MRFGPAGIPNSSPKKDTLTGLKTVKDLGLDAMELEFVYGVRMSESTALKVRDLAKELDIKLSAHAPYYINLNAQEKVKIERSIKNLVDSAKIAYYAGAESVVFHPGWYMRKPKETAYRNVKENLKKALQIIQDNGWNVILRPETMDSLQKFGDLDEVIRLSQELENVLPCIDFAHLRYRYQRNDVEFFRKVLEKIENELGKEALKNMHIHISGIKLDKHGTHINLNESDIPWQEILKLLKEFNVDGIIISESPNLEEDALMLKKYWEKL